MKTKRILALVAALVATSFAFASCGGDGDGSSVPSVPSSESSESSSTVGQTTATISETEAAILVGETKTLTVGNYTGEVTWITSDASVATVADGVVTGVAEGTAYITAKVSDGELTCRVNVTEAATVVPTLVLDKSSTEIGKGFTLNVTAYVQVGLEFTKLDKTAVTWASSDETVATISGGTVSGLKEGTTTVTATYVHEGQTLTTTATFTVLNINYHKAYCGGQEVTSVNPVKVVVADSYIGTTSNSTATIQIKEYDISTGEATDVTQNIVWQSTDPAVATASGATVTGVTKNGSAELIGTLNGHEVTRVYVDGWTEITTKAHMNELSLATWKLRSGDENIEKMEAVLDGKYVLGGDIDYAGEYLLPIANTAPDRVRMDNFPTGLISYCSWVWEDILKPLTPEAEWTAFHFNTKENTFSGSNPLNKAFTGVFDGNGYTIANAQILDVNHLYAQRGSNPGVRFTAGGGCFIGTNEGTVKNINFEELRYRKWHGASAADRETKLESRQIYCGSVSATIPYSNTVGVTTNSALVRINKGTLSDIRITAYTKPAYSEWDRIDAKQTTASALGVCFNDSTGVVNNMVIVSKKGEIPHLAYDKDDATYDFASVVGVNTNYANYIFYAYNAGTIENSVFMSEAPEGHSAQVSLTEKKGGYNTVNYIRHYGDDGQTGTLTGTTGSEGLINNVGAYFADWDYDVLTVFNQSGMVMDSYSAAYWDTTTMTMKKGVWAI